MKGKVLFTKKTKKGIYGFIACEDGSSHYFDTSGIIKGNFLKPESEVEFDVIPSRDDKTQAINIRLCSIKIEYDILPQEKLETILDILSMEIQGKSFLNCTVLPALFQRASINYKDFAEDLKSFVEKYLYTSYLIERSYPHEDRIYPMVIVPIVTDDCALDMGPIVTQKIIEAINESGFLTAEKVPAILKSLGIDNYRKYAETMDQFIEKFCQGLFLPKKRIKLNGKLYPKIYVSKDNADSFHEEDDTISASSQLPVLDPEIVLVIKKLFCESIEENDYITGGVVPALLRRAGIENYKEYAKNLEEFIDRYLSDMFEMRKNEIRNGKCEPSIIIFKTNDEPSSPLHELYSSGDFRAFLSSPLLKKATPLTLGVDGIQMTLNMLADYLGENREPVSINEFHKILLSTSTVSDLKQYKDDSELLTLGAQTSYITLSPVEYGKIFADVHNGKKNLNNNWNGVLERFWTAKNNLAFYLTCISIIISKKDSGIDLYIDESSKETTIEKLPTLLKVYTDFARDGINDISVRLKRKIIGHCFDCHDMDALRQSYQYFDNRSLREMSDVIAFLDGDISIDCDIMMSWFHGELESMIAEKIANYFWWKESRDAISDELLRILSSIVWEYPENYFAAIVYDNSCPNFGKDQKESVLVNTFTVLCERVKQYKKAFILASYIYYHYIKALENEHYNLVWNALSAWMKEQVVNQLTQELASAGAIRMFRYDEETTRELEQYYCSTYVAEELKKISSEDDLDSYINRCVELDLPFITQWVVDHNEDTAVKDKEKYAHSLIDARRFTEAITFIQSESSFYENKKLELVKEALCKNFEVYALSDAAYQIFENCIPEKVAEHILLRNLVFMEAATLSALISIYARRKDWAKALYIYIPFKAFHENGRKPFINDFYKLANAERVLEKNNPLLSHYDVVKCALKVYDPAEFDAFIEWARKIAIPATSKKYEPKPKTFDNVIKTMLGKCDYDDAWKQLLLTAIRTDNNEKQDSLRYCIITSFIGRYGLDGFEKMVVSLSKNKYSTKGFSDYYISLWKGLLTGKYSVNFLSLSKQLVNQAPLTFWNIFYDVSVCKNHVFSTSDFELKSWVGLKYDLQTFYDELLSRYSITRETVFVKIAANILSESREDIIPSFEHYVPYCNSNRSKDFLFVTLIKLISDCRYTSEIVKFLKSDYWRCEEEEQQLIRVLQAICTDEYDYFFADNLQFNEDDFTAFKYDFLECAKTYPKVSISKAIRDSIHERKLAYQYKLLEWIIHILTIDVRNDFRSVLNTVPYIGENAQSNVDFTSYLNLASAMYKYQLKMGSNDIIYIKNRYYRLLVIGVLSEAGENEFSDDEIVMLMQRNKHFTNIYPEYKEFKKHILDFVTSKDIPEKLKTVFLLGVISNNWEQFVDLGHEYSENSLKLIHIIESSTNFLDLNIQILKKHIYEQDPNEYPNIEYVQTCSPSVYSVLQQMKHIFEDDFGHYERYKEIVVGIAHLDEPDKARRAYVNLQNYLKNRPADLNAHWDMYMAVLLSTSYVKTIINALAEEIRRRKIFANTVQNWRPVFSSMKQLSAYYYLLAVKYAIERNVESAKQALASMPSADELPVEWNEEKSRLEGYLSGKEKYFNPGEGSSIATLSVEKEATDVSFIAVVSQAHLNPTTNNYSGVNAYRSILQSENDIEDVSKYNLYVQLFSYLKNADDLYEIYRQIDGTGQNARKNRLTYNELVIEYGSLSIAYNEQLTPDQKMDVLLEIFDIYQLLNDINKVKANIINRLILAEQFVLETPGVSFEKWLSSKDQILQIFKHEVISYPQADIAKWLKPVQECAYVLQTNETEMGVLTELLLWRNNYNLLPDCPNYENAFVRSVDEKIQVLKSGVNLILSVNNTEIEDGCVFYQIKNVSPYNNVSVHLCNGSADGAHLQVLIKINNGKFEPFDASFSNELDLRSNDTCGQAYRLPSKVLEVISEGDELTVILNIVYNGRIICNNAASQCKFQFVSYESILAPNLIPNAIHYGTAVPAFSTTIKGFGREQEKADLRDLIDQNLAIIYGPSRAGKSSLLNYLANEYLNEYSDFSGCSSFMRIRVADEQNSKNDYVQNMVTGEELRTFENSTQIMEYLFLSPMQIAFSDTADIKKMRMCKVIGDAFPEDAKSEIRLVLSQNGSVVEKYGAISQILSDYHCQVWLLFDEFQQIVEKWVGNADELAELCTAIKYNQSSIKLVLCGSDELVRIFECSHDSNWDEFKVKTAGTLVFVGQLSESDFGDMMNDRAIWRNVPENYPWNVNLEESTNLPAALKSLYEYTGGNAICGKLFGEEILKKLKDGYFARRKYIYPSDITHIAYEVLTSEASQIKNLLITHTTKNLQNERPYLLFIAHELASDTNRSEVSFRRICEFFAVKESPEIETALKLLVARGILKTGQGSHKYSFATMYYFDCYKNQATDFVIGKLKDMMTEASQENQGETIQPNIMDIMQLYDTLTPPEKYRILSMVYADDKLPKESMEEFKKRIANSYRDIIQYQNNIQINAQTINTAFTTLLSPGTDDQLFLSAIQSLPGLATYLSDDQQKLISSHHRALKAHYSEYDKCYDESGNLIDVSRAEQLERDIIDAENALEKISALAEQKILSDNFGAVVASDDFMTLTDERWESLLGIDAAGVKKLKELLPTEIVTSLTFAVVLHNVFNSISEIAQSREEPGQKYVDQLDYCPVAIMYCKIIEALLKKSHTPLYIRGLGNKTIKKGSDTVFADLGEPDDFNAGHKDLSIGSYVTHIVYLPKKKYSLGPPQIKPNKKDFFFKGNDYDYIKNIKCLIDNEDIEDELMGPWMTHARALKIIHEIRNRSAHEAVPITRENFDWLIEVLFKNEELLRIWELSKKG